jgi:endonuclease/exonuclease/phosphatase family metal-dependent hydrolase
MTFNLRYASPTPPNAWPQRRPIMRALILEHAPDVIGTQEGLYQQLKDLAADLPMYDWIGLGREGGSRGEFMAVFYRKERLEPLEFDHFWLSETPKVIGSTSWGNRLPRMATWVKFRDRRTALEFYFVNTHFDHQSQPAREKSATLVRQWAEQLQTKLPLLLVGDFNAAAEANKVYQLLVGPDGFTDTWTVAQKRGEAIGTFHNYRGVTRQGSRIDWILTRGAVTTVSTEVVTYARDGQYPSDHFPVAARLRLAAASP